MAAAAVIAIRKRKGSVSAKEEEEPNYVEDKLPPVELRESDAYFGLQLGGAWQRRRIIFTKEIIAFADPVNEEIMTDHILLAEVESVRNVDDMDDEETVSVGKLQHVFMITTVVHGRNSGRTYYLQAESKAHCNQIVATLAKSAAISRQRAEAKTRFSRAQQQVKIFFDSSAIQGISAALILLNFLVSIVDAQFGPDVVHDEDYTDKQMTISKLADMSGSFNSAFTAIFTVELFLNIFGNGFRRFMASGWNWLDLFIVTMSLVDLVVENIPAWLVGLMRAIRVIRLFGRVKELKKMSTAVTASVFPMMNAFVILIVILCIFSILGVSLFSKVGPDEFGRFNRAFITCFRMVTGDSWPESLPMLQTDGAIDVKASLFFCSFSIVVAWIILQVSVAVLIDNFVAASARLENEAKMKIVMEKKKVNMYKNPLEPLIAKLAMSYVDRADLEEKLKALFQSLDSDGSGDLSSTEFCAAIRKLNFTPCIYMTEPDFMNLSRNGALCNQDGTVDCERFRYIMMEQIRAYTMTLLTVHSTYLTPEEEEFSRRGTLKMIMMDQQQMQDRMDRSSPKGKSEERVLDAKIESTSKTDSYEHKDCFEAETGSMASSDTTKQASIHSHDSARHDAVRAELAELRELMHSTCQFVCLGDESAKLHLLEVWKRSHAKGADPGSLAKTRRAHKGGPPQHHSARSAAVLPDAGLSPSAEDSEDVRLSSGSSALNIHSRKLTFLTLWKNNTVYQRATKPYTPLDTKGHLNRTELPSSTGNARTGRQLRRSNSDPLTSLAYGISDRRSAALIPTGRTDPLLDGGSQQFPSITRLSMKEDKEAWLQVRGAVWNEEHSVSFNNELQPDDSVNEASRRRSAPPTHTTNAPELQSDSLPFTGSGSPRQVHVDQSLTKIAMDKKGSMLRRKIARSRVVQNMGDHVPSTDLSAVNATEEHRPRESSEIRREQNPTSVGSDQQARVFYDLDSSGQPTASLRASRPVRGQGRVLGMSDVVRVSLQS